MGAFNKKIVWRVEFDIQTYYESIHIDTLLEILKESFHIRDERLLNILEQQLKTWSENPTMCGIPQGANASHILANAYLCPLDAFLDDLKSNGDFEYFRYADDIIIMAKSADKINHIVEQVVLFLRKYNLKLNGKTKLEKLKDTANIEELKFYNPYGQLNDTSQQKVAKIGKQLPRILRKMRSGEDVKKTEISELRYYLKAGANLGSPEMLDDLIALIPKRPSLIYLVCRYLGSYLSDIDKDFYETHKKLIHSKYEKVWKTYCGNSLTGWTKFWLLKVLSAPTFAKEHNGFQSELNGIVADPNAKFLRPLAFFYKAYVGNLARDKVMKGKPIDSIDAGFTLDDIKRHIRNSKTETEKAIYYYFAVYLRGIEEDEVIKELVYEALQSKSLEIQTMGIFLVEKLYHREVFETPKKEVGVGDIVVTKDMWGINLEREMLGEFGRIYFKLPPPETPTKTKDEFLTNEGKIAQDKLAPFFGIPISVKIVEMPEIKVSGLQVSSSRKRTKNSSLELYLNAVGDLWREPKSKYCYPIGETSERHKIVRFLIKNKGYQKTRAISDAVDGKSEQSIRTEIGKIRKNISKYLGVKNKEIIESKKESGYCINPEYKITIKD